MFPAFVFAIAGQLLGKLGSPIFQELSLAWGVSDDLPRLENTVLSVRAVLLDAEERQESSHQLNMKHLKFLNLSANRELKALPASICELVGLENLDFDGCWSIEKLPTGIGQLIRLERLAISTKESYLPENELRCLTSLWGLIISHCPNLKFVMSDDSICCLSALRTLLIEECESLLSLPAWGLSRLTRFENILIKDCGLLNFTMDNNKDCDIGENESGGGEEGFRSLQSLAVSELPKLESLPMCLLPHGANNLKSLSVGACDNLKNIMPEPMLENLKSLHSLRINKCPKVNSLPEGMLSLTALHEIRIRECPQLVSRCEREIGEDWHKICHVPNIYLNGKKI